MDKVKFVGLTFLYQEHILLVKEPDGFGKTTNLTMKWGIPGGGPMTAMNIMNSTFLGGDQHWIDQQLIQEASREFFEETMGIFGSQNQIVDILYNAIQKSKVLAIGIPPNYFAFYVWLDELPFKMDDYSIIFQNCRHFITECGTVRPECLEISEVKFVPLDKVKELNLRRSINAQILEQIISWIQKKK